MQNPDISPPLTISHTHMHAHKHTHQGNGMEIIGKNEGTTGGEELGKGEEERIQSSNTTRLEMSLRNPSFVHSHTHEMFKAYLIISIYMYVAGEIQAT